MGTKCSYYIECLFDSAKSVYKCQSYIQQVLSMSLHRQYKKFVQFLQKYIHKPKTPINKAAVLRYLALLLIIIVAFLIRIYPFIPYETVFRAFDPWYQYRVTKYVFEHGFTEWFSWRDFMSWYPYGRDVPKSTYPGVPFTAVVLYYILHFFGLNVDIFHVAYFMPAIMGTLGTITMYFLGKEIGGKRTGLFAALFLATSAGYVQRTIVGFFDNETVGVLAILLVLLFFIRALKYGSVKYSILAGLSLGYLSASWGAAIYVFDLLPLTAFTLILLKRYSQRLLISFSTTMSIGLIIATMVPRHGIKIVTSSYGLPTWFVLALMAIIEVYPFLKTITGRLIDIMYSIYEKIPENVFSYKRYIAYLSAIIIVVLLGYAYEMDMLTIETATNYETQILQVIGGKFWTILDPLYREQDRILASVGEHLPSPWSTFFYNLHLLTLLMPIGFYFLFKRGKEEDVLVIIFGITAVYFTGSMIRIILILAPAAALIGAFGIVTLLTPLAKLLRYKPTIVSRRRKRIGYVISKEIVVMVFIVMFILFSMQIIHDTSTAKRFATPEMVPHSTLRDWPEALEYMRMYLPDNAVVVSWWDYGYWITTVANKTTVVDNATLNSTQIALVGYMFMAPNETESLRILKKFNATHVLVHFGLFEQGLGGDEYKWIWMARIATDKLGYDIINDTEYYAEGEKDPVQDLFFNSTIFKLLLFREPGGRLANLVSQHLQSGFYKWQTHIPAELQFFEVEYFSTNHLVKIYKINWDAWEEYCLEHNVSTTWP